MVRNTIQNETWAILLTVVVAVIGHANHAAAEETDALRWSIIKTELFGDAAIQQKGQIISLQAPTRAEHAAIVPIEIKLNSEGAEGNSITKLYLVVDQNPSPIVGTFTLSGSRSVRHLSTRVRVNAYSHVRAIAQTSNGALYMDTRYVKASGGCSAPPTLADEEAEQRRGKMKLRQRTIDDRLELQLMISHPNHSGLQINQLTRNWIPPDYVSHIEMHYNNKPMLIFEGGISMSENPSLRLSMDQHTDEGRLSVQIRDSKKRSFQDAWSVAH